MTFLSTNKRLSKRKFCRTLTEWLLTLIIINLDLFRIHKLYSKSLVSISFICCVRSRVPPTIDGYFENLGKPSTEPYYDEDFKEYIDGKVKHILHKCLNSSSCIEDIFGFEKVKKVCLNLPCNKAGGIDNTAYEYLKFGGKQLWQVLSDLFVFMYSTHDVQSFLKIQLFSIPPPPPPHFQGQKT